MSELKRPERYVNFESIKPELREITEFYTRKVKDYLHCLKQLNEYADALENEISVLKETPKVEVLLDDMPKPLVVVPQIMADFIEEWKEEFKLYGAFFEISEAYGPGTELYDLVFQKSNGQDLFARAWLDGYTVEKEPKFSLVNKITGEYLVLPAIEFRIKNENIFDHSTHCKKDDLPEWKPEMYQFTEVEITSMETGSYEQIEVEP